MTYTKPLPRRIPEAEGFWASVKAHAIALPWCLDCNRPHYYPQGTCPFCLGPNIEYRPASGNGTIYSFSKVNRAPTADFKNDVPYTLCMVDLEEGVRIFTTLVDDDADQVRIGMPVRVVYDDVTEEVSLPRVAPRLDEAADEGGAA
jgi:uncharacterized OB-fold protein